LGSLEKALYGGRLRLKAKKSKRLKRPKKIIRCAAKQLKSAARKTPWSLYILECGDGSLYTGISNNVQKRFACHCKGKGARYTRTHQPVKLMYVEECGPQGMAMSREREVKRFPKKKKLKLIASGTRPAEE
jgi:putative endonuclease